MRYRVAFALAFVALVGGLIVLRDHGFLGGRETGGPLDFGGDGRARVTERDRAVAFALEGALDGAGVRVQNVRPRVASPELEVIGPTLSGGRSLEDALVEGPAVRAKVRLRAERAGLYYALGMIVDYRRGQRRFRERTAQTLCISVRTKQRCDLAYNGPGDARVAQVGGPSRYPDARLTPGEARYERPGEYRLRLTVANQTRSAIDVSSIALDRNDAGVSLTSAQPEDFHLPPHGYRVVRLRARFAACGPDQTFDRLRAELDGERRSIPLSLPLRFGCA